MGPIHWGGPQATRSVVQGCSTAMTPQPVGRDAQVSGPSMHAAATSMARGQRRMVGRSSSMTDRSCSAAQAVQTMTVNGRSVAPCDEVNVARPVRFRGDRSHVMSSCRSLLSSGYLEEQAVSAAAACPGQGDDAVFDSVGGLAMSNRGAHSDRAVFIENHFRQALRETVPYREV
jgi:hypothetical protein